MEMPRGGSQRQDRGLLEIFDTKVIKVSPLCGPQRSGPASGDAANGDTQPGSIMSSPSPLSLGLPSRLDDGPCFPRVLVTPDGQSTVLAVPAEAPGLLLPFLCLRTLAAPRDTDETQGLTMLACPGVQKVPQTSVAPTYKLTLPSEFVVTNLSHLVDQAFELVDKEGTGSWQVALLPRRCAPLPHACMPHGTGADGAPASVTQQREQTMTICATLGDELQCKRAPYMRVQWGRVKPAR